MFKPEFRLHIRLGPGLDIMVLDPDPIAVAVAAIDELIASPVTLKKSLYKSFGSRSVGVAGILVLDPDPIVVVAITELIFPLATLRI